MSSNPFLDLNPRDYSLTEDHSSDIESIDRLLGRVLRAQGEHETLDTVRLFLQECENDGSCDIWESIPALQNVSVVKKVLRAITVLFQLLNLAEQKEIVRVNRRREAESTSRPRHESILDTVQKLKESGMDAGAMQYLLHQLDVSPTLTAHPTEARRRAVLDKLESLALLLEEQSGPSDRARLGQPLNRRLLVNREMERTLAALWLTEELSLNPVTVMDEARNSMYFLEHTIFDVVCRLRSDLQNALEKIYPGRDFVIPPFLRYRTWVGGDRDGNPKVTPEVTWTTLIYLKRKVLQQYIHKINRLIREYTQSERLAPAAQALQDSLFIDRGKYHLSERLFKQYQSEPYALKLLFIRGRLYRTLKHLRIVGDYHTLGELAEPPRSVYRNADELIADLRVIQESLRGNNTFLLSDNNPLSDLIFQVQTFGFHFATLDVRQHSREHEVVLGEVFSAARMIPERRMYADLLEEEKIRLLTREVFDPRPLLPRGWPPSSRARHVLEVFDVVRHAQRWLSPESVNSYIISMTHSVSDMLEVLVLAKESGLIRWQDEYGARRLESRMDIVPLFETIDDLDRCDDLMKSVFANEAYREHLNARGSFQEIMLGYSDSSKDGGYMAANWYLNGAQERLARLCREERVTTRLFHGRGGTVGRGGGRAYLAIRSQPARSVNGRIRFTEQGEVISFRYGFVPIAHRHLEQIVGAVLLASNPMNQREEIPSAWREAMSMMAEESKSTYREFINHSDFWPFYIQATPIDFISQLPIASRPVSRSGDSMVGMEDLRAIPWVFSWIQCRYLIPGWYGVGSALENFVGQSSERLALLREMNRNWSFFATVLNNASLELERTHIHTAAWYASKVNPKDLGERMHEKIASEHRRAVVLIAKIQASETGSAKDDVVKKTIRLRNPLVAPLNRLQVELVDLCRQGKGNPNFNEAEWREAVLLSIAGIAAAMQSTG